VSLADYLRALRKRWWMIVLSALAGTALATILVFQQTPIYQGTVTFFATTPSTDASSSLQGDQFGQQRVNSYVSLLSSQSLAERVLERTGLELSARNVMSSIEGKADLNTVLLTAYVRDSSRAQAESMTEAVAEEFPDLVEDIESQSGTKEAPVQLDVVSGPAMTPYAVSPQKRLWVAAGFMLGLMVGVGLALLRALLDRSVRSPDMLREATRTPVLGRIPFDSSSKRSPVLKEGDKRWSRAEAFRQLRTNLQFVDIEEPVSVLVVTSSLAGEGKSSTAANLAITFAEAGKRVLLVDADLRRPRLASMLGLEWAVGLTNVLAGQVQLSEVVQQWGGHGLEFLASGPHPPNPSELLGSSHMVSLLAEARQRYDLVIVDTAPLLPVTDGAIAAARADGALVVVRYGKTRTAEVERAVESLRAVDARVLGTVLNRSPLKGEGAYGYDNYRYKEKPPRARRGPRSRQRRRAQQRVAGPTLPRDGGRR
jgi:capsular exopolysaccharide synthesis family protein